MENLTLTTPITIPGYHVATLNLDWDAQFIFVRLRTDSGHEKCFQYAGPQAVTLMAALNTANLSTKSLHRRILEYLVAQSELEGEVTGAPA